MKGDEWKRWRFFFSFFCLISVFIYLFLLKIFWKKMDKDSWHSSTEEMKIIARDLFHLLFILTSF